MVKLWHLKFDQTLDECLMVLNILLFQGINDLRKVTKEVQIPAIKPEKKRPYNQKR
jgi:hypothetical protein